MAFIKLGYEALEDFHAMLPYEEDVIYVSVPQ
jgi:hypothetical protein